MDRDLYFYFLKKVLSVQSVMLVKSGVVKHDYEIKNVRFTPINKLIMVRY